MIKTESKIVKKEALEVFKLIQSYMGDRKLTKDVPASHVAFDIVQRGWSISELRDEIFIQICRQTRRNPREYVQFNSLLVIVTIFLYMRVYVWYVCMYMCVYIYVLC